MHTHNLLPSEARIFNLVLVEAHQAMISFMLMKGIRGTVLDMICFV